MRTAVATPAREHASAYIQVSNSLCASPIVGITIITLTLIQLVVVQSSSSDATIQLSLSPRSIRDADDERRRDIADARRLSTCSLENELLLLLLLLLLFIVVAFSEWQQNNEAVQVFWLGRCVEQTKIHFQNRE